MMIKRLANKLSFVKDRLREIPIIRAVFKTRVVHPGTATHFLFVPSHDYITNKMTAWAKSWNLPNVSLFHGAAASHSNAVSKLNNNVEINPVIVFLGHGSPTELLTELGAGKPSTSIKHGCLMNIDDVTEDLCGIQILAWSCSSGKYFGEKVGRCSESAFFGFSEKVVMHIDPKNDDLWRNLIKETISRVTNKHVIEQTDKNWFKTRVSELRRDIKSGKINTGSRKADVFNLLFLRRIAKNVNVHM